MENVGICILLIHIWYTLRPFGIFDSDLVYLMAIWYFFAILV
jgi:hypothetical protein